MIRVCRRVGSYLWNFGRSRESIWDNVEDKGDVLADEDVRIIEDY